MVEKVRRRNTYLREYIYLCVYVCVCECMGVRVCLSCGYIVFFFLGFSSFSW